MTTKIGVYDALMAVPAITQCLEQMREFPVPYASKERRCSNALQVSSGSTGSQKPKVLQRTIQIVASPGLPPDALRVRRITGQQVSDIAG